MSSPVFEPLSGTIDGSNAVFYFSEAYEPGSTAVYLNGQLLTHSSGNPWTESDPANGEITITGANCIPRPGDDMAGFSLKASDENLIQEVTNITGSIEEVLEIQGEIVGVDLAGSFETTGELSGILAPEAEIEGSVELMDISAVLETC